MAAHGTGASWFCASRPLACSHACFRQLAQLAVGIAVSAGKRGDAAAKRCCDRAWRRGRSATPAPSHACCGIYRAGKPLVLDGVGGEPLPPRLMHALRIYRAGKAPLIVISAADAPEAQLNADRLVELGAPRSALILETESQNTRENAVNAAAIFKEHGWRTGLLVTSAAHMPRALAAFQKVGLSLTPAATDIRASPLRSLRFVSLLDLLPDAGALNRTMLAIKEMIGLCIYRLLGWA